MMHQQNFRSHLRAAVAVVADLSRFRQLPMRCYVPFQLHEVNL